MKNFLMIVWWFVLSGDALAQQPVRSQVFISPDSDSSFFSQGPLDKNKASGNRLWLAGGLALGGMSSSLLFLTKSNNYQYSKEFNFINDNNAWLQMDKSEHMFLSYTTTRLLTGLGEWAGISPANAVLIGSTGSLLYLTTKEYLDGHHTNWGWSWADMGANFLGTGLYTTQELLWQEQKIHLKFSALPRNYEPALKARANILFGQSSPERILKDYNAQTYWLSFNLKAITGNDVLPGWINLAVGYGADDMYGPYKNLGYTKGLLTFDRTDLKRYRQWYLSPDIDLTKIKTKSRFVKSILFTLNAVKVPLPALTLSKQKLNAHWLHF